MVTLHQFRVRWTGMLGQPGVSTFYCSGSPATFKTDLVTFFTAEKSIVPAAVTITVPSTGSDIDSGTGAVTGTWTSGTDTLIACTATGGFAAPVGIVINWHTGAYISGRELKGKTFIVPVKASAFDTDGTLTTADRAGVIGDANTLKGSAATMVVWSKTHAAIGTVTSATVPDKAAVLRSRRD